MWGLPLAEHAQEQSSITVAERASRARGGRDAVTGHSTEEVREPAPDVAWPLEWTEPRQPLRAAFWGMSRVILRGELSRRCLAGLERAPVHWVKEVGPSQRGSRQHQALTPKACKEEMKPNTPPSRHALHTPNPPGRQRGQETSPQASLTHQPLSTCCRQATSLHPDPQGGLGVLSLYFQPGEPTLGSQATCPKPPSWDANSELPTPRPRLLLNPRSARPDASTRKAVKRHTPRAMHTEPHVRGHTHPRL